MKTINTGVLLDEVIATCNFCCEEKKQCYRSPYKVGFAYWAYRTVLGGFGYNNEIVRSKTIEREDREVNICTDCITQLSKIVK